jgi:hypothetical protein
MRLCQRRPFLTLKIKKHGGAIMRKMMHWSRLPEHLPLALAHAFACLIILAASPATAQLGYCLGNDRDPTCRLQRQMEEQERQNRLRHEETMQEMRRQNQQQMYQPQPYQPSAPAFPRVFDGPFRAF